MYFYDIHISKNNTHSPKPKALVRIRDTIQPTWDCMGGLWYCSGTQGHARLTLIILVTVTNNLWVGPEAILIVICKKSLNGNFIVLSTALSGPSG